jgi:competence protein ComEA
MSTGIRSFSGATLSRSQQAIILGLGFGLVCLWIWQTSLVSPASPPSNSPEHCYVEVRGDIPYPGMRVFSACPSLQEVWETAGGRGILPNGSQVLSSGSKIRLSEDGGVILERMAGPDLLALGLAINPNNAAATDLEAIPGIGPVLARRIIEFREEQGPFQHIEDLLAVKGLGPGKLKKIKSYLEVSEIGAEREAGKNNY